MEVKGDLVLSSGARSVVPRPASFGITWKLDANVNSQALPRCIETETLDAEPATCF